MLTGSSYTKYSNIAITNISVAWKHVHVVAAVFSPAQLCWIVYCTQQWILSPWHRDSRRCDRRAAWPAAGRSAGTPHTQYHTPPPPPSSLHLPSGSGTRNQAIKMTQFFFRIHKIEGTTNRFSAHNNKNNTRIKCFGSAFFLCDYSSNLIRIETF